VIDFTVSDLRELINNHAWEEIRGRMLEALMTAEMESENPDPFRHGLGIGAKRTIKTLLELPERMEEELTSKGKLQRVGPMDRLVQ